MLRMISYAHTIIILINKNLKKYQTKHRNETNTGRKFVNIVYQNDVNLFPLITK